MRQSELFTKTSKQPPADEPSINAQLLTRGGFVFKNSAGVYSYLPLGWRVIEKINRIIREEMNAIGGVEILMPALVERKYLEATDRFKLDVGFDVLGKGDKEAAYSLGWTHEEVLTSIVSKYISSHKDLPLSIYQIQTKFRNEARAKSGLLRGREFLMKDLYSFHVSEEDLFKYYEKVKEAYFKVFTRCSLDPYYTLAGGGAFTMANTHEFQVLSKIGEDEIFYCANCKTAENKEISKLSISDKCKACRGEVKLANSIEVGNIFPLGAKYADAFDLKFTDEKGVKRSVVMGSYGIGVSRLVGTVVEVYNDDKGIIWPDEIAPFKVHLVYLPSNSSRVKNESDRICNVFQKLNIEVLYDDRDDVTAGEKFADADLLGMPVRVVVSERSLGKEGVEVKKRNESVAHVISTDDLIATLKNNQWSMTQ